MKAAQMTLFSFFQKREGKDHPNDDAGELSTSSGQRAKSHLVPSPIQPPSPSSTRPSSPRSSDTHDPLFHNSTTTPFSSTTSRNNQTSAAAANVVLTSLFFHFCILCCYNLFNATVGCIFSQYFIVYILNIII